MRRIERMRRRTGARRWGLYQAAIGARALRGDVRRSTRGTSTGASTRASRAATAGSRSVATGCWRRALRRRFGTACRQTAPNSRRPAGSGPPEGVRGLGQVARVGEAHQRLLLDLANTLAREPEAAADLFERHRAIPPRRSRSAARSRRAPARGAGRPRRGPPGGGAARPPPRPVRPALRRTGRRARRRRPPRPAGRGSPGPGRPRGRRGRGRAAARRPPPAPPP